MKIEIDKMKIYYHEVGEGKPFLAVHGWLTDHQYIQRIFEPVFERREGWRRIYIDLPGRGQSPGSDRIKSSGDELNLLLKFINAKFSGENFVLAGLSYGGLLARGVLRQRMETIDGLALIVPSVEADPSRRKSLPPRVVLVRDETAIQELEPEEKDGIFENSLVIQDKPSLGRLRDRVLPSIKLTDRPFLERLSESYGFTYDVDDLPQPYEHPALFLFGRQDHIVGYQSAINLMENFPRATFAVLDKAGHFLGGVEHVELSRVLISEWLDRVEAHVTIGGSSTN